MASPAKLSRAAINNILLATDFSPESQNAFHCAVAIARRYASTVLLTHVLPPEGSMGVGESWASLADTVRCGAEKSMARLENTGELGSIAHETIIKSGITWDVISHTLDEKNVDLLVMGTHGDKAVKKLFLGSTAETASRHAGCPVLTVGPHVELGSCDRFHHILYATDFSSGSLSALTYALALAEDDRAELTLLHVIESQPASEAELLDWKRQDGERLRRMVPPGMDLAYEPEIELEVGVPDVEVVRLADTRKADLIVMGCHGGGALSTHMPWTTLHHVLRNAHCPVLTVRSK
ncbi:MAG: universal stress protein [Candidatus Korobacteraceae bacterium]